jgi:hypothetical protein
VQVLPLVHDNGGLPVDCTLRETQDDCIDCDQKGFIACSITNR